MLNENGTIFIEVPNANEALLTLYKSQAFADFKYGRCYLYLYNAETLKLLTEKCGLTTKFIRQIQRYSVANHLHWLSNNKPGGHCEWAFLENDSIAKEYENILANLGIADTLIGGFIKL